MVLWETVLYIALKMIVHIITRKVANKPKLRVILKNNWHVLFSNSNLMKAKES